MEAKGKSKSTPKAEDATLTKYAEAMQAKFSDAGEKALLKEVKKYRANSPGREPEEKAVDNMRWAVNHVFYRGCGIWVPDYLPHVLRVMLAELPARIAEHQENELRDELGGEILEGLLKTKTTAELRKMAAAYQK